MCIFSAFDERQKMKRKEIEKRPIFNTNSSHFNPTSTSTISSGSSTPSPQLTRNNLCFKKGSNKTDSFSTLSFDKFVKRKITDMDGSLNAADKSTCDIAETRALNNTCLSECTKSPEGLNTLISSYDSSSSDENTWKNHIRLSPLYQLHHV